MRVVYLALVVFLGFATATWHGAVRAHGAEADQIELPYPEALSCFGINKVEKVGQYMASRLGKPAFVMVLDSNEDGKRDILLVFNAYHYEGDLYVSVTPSYIVLDDDGDGHPDRAYEIRVADKFDCSAMKKVSLDQLLQDYKGA